jgi:hypothetical protein
MRHFIAAAAFAAMASPAMAQGSVKVGVKQQLPDTVRVLREQQITRDQARKLWVELNALITQNMRDHDQWMHELKSGAPDEKRVALLLGEMEQNTWVLLPKQSEFATMCAVLRRQEGETPGTIGLQLDDSVHWVYDPQFGTLTVVVPATRKIAAVTPGSPAEKSGIQVGDILTAINGRPFIDSVKFNELLNPGSPVTARVQRDGREFDTKTMIVVRRPSDYPRECDNARQADFSSPFFNPGTRGVITMTPFRSGDRTPPQSKLPGGPNIQMFMYTTSKALYGGAVMQPLDDEWRAFSGLQGEGLIVTDLPAGSPAEAAGLRRFDVIKLVNNEPVTSVTVFQKIARAEQKLTFTVFSKQAGVHTVTMVR